MDVLIGGTIFVLAMLVVSRLAQWLHVSAPLLLMSVGLGASFLPFIEVPRLQPEFILLWILPPLLHAAALNTSLIDFRRNIATIGWLSIGLVFATALAVGVVASALLDLPLPIGVALGAVVAPPDAVASTAVAKRVGLPRRPEDLALCLTCGHIGCESELHNAREHFESTGHPVLRSFTPGESWRHCLVHDVGTD